MTFSVGSTTKPCGKISRMTVPQKGVPEKN